MLTWSHFAYNSKNMGQHGLDSLSLLIILCSESSTNRNHSAILPSYFPILLLTLNATMKAISILILAIRRARVELRRSATRFIKNRNCARSKPGGPIEPENFERRKRREHGEVGRSRIVSFFLNFPLFIYFNMSCSVLL